MNPQYAPQPQFGPSSQVFPSNRASPSLGPPQPAQGFQNVPLGPQRPPSGPPSNFGLPPPQAATPKSQIPQSQLPPSFGPDQKPSGPPSNQFPKFQNGPPQEFQNGPGFGPLPPTTQGLPNNPPSQLSTAPGPPLLQNSNQRPLEHQPPFPEQTPTNQPPFSGQHQKSNQPPVIGHPQINQPPVTGQPHGPPPMSRQPQNAPHMPGQPPHNQPPLPGQPHNQPPLPGQPQLNQPPVTGQPHGQPPMSRQPPIPGQPQNAPHMPGQPPHNQPPLPGQPHNQPPLPGQPQINQSPQQPFNQPPQINQPPFPTQPNQFVGHPTSQPGQPPFNQPPKPGPPLINQPYPGQPPFQKPGPPATLPPGPPGPNRLPPGSGSFPQPPPPGQPFPPGPNQLTNQMQGMNLGGPRQYPGAPIQNGDNGGPHMPPPLNQQQQFVNGQQGRAPPGGPGYPPAPSQPGAYPGNYPQPAYQQQQQPKRLDPDQMPSPIQVTQDDQNNRSGIFCTNQKGLVPPLVTTNFIVQDQGNTSPRFIRSTMYNVPISQDIMKQTAVPFSLVISPMARTIDQEYPPPIVNFGELGPVRCIRCKAYMCPFMQFIDSGRRFQCLFCKATTDVPAEYFQHLDHTGQRLDRYERPELVLGTYEFVATTDYCRNNVLPKPPAIIFVIDVSYNNVKSGLVHLLCDRMKEIIKNLPLDQGQEKSNMRVGFITYNSSVHFYNVKGNLAAPQMLIVGDTQDMFMPLLDGFLCTPEESEPVIDALMQQIPAMFGETRETETILLPAILAGLEALKASECTGKLVVFHSTLPSAEAPGKLKNRDDRKLLGTDKEKTILTPQTQAYNQLGQDCVGAGCSVDLFLFNNAYIDIASIGQVSRLSGGEVYKYTYFQADIDGERLVQDIITDISRPIAFDAIMRVRTSTGVRPTDFYGHFYMSNTTDIELAAIDCDKAVAVEIKHDDKLNEEEGVYIQAALLYTSCSGQRRLRIINLSLKTCSQMAELYRSCDCDTIINYMAKQSTYKLLEHSPKAVKDNIVSRAAQILATYRKNCASPSSAGQLILPECMKLLPLYVNCLLKSDALSGGSDMTIDDRSFVMQEVMIMDIPNSVNYFYPRLIPLVELDATQETVEVPASIRCTYDKMNEQGVYILENGIYMFLWIGLGASPDFIQKVFGAPSAIQVEVERIALPELDNPLSLAVRTIIDEIRIQRHRHMRLTIVRQREKLEAVFKHFLAEDRGTDGSPSYVDFLIHMHKEIRTLLS